MIADAGDSNMISSRCKPGKDAEWVVDTEIYAQCEETGNWYRRADESCPCPNNCTAK